MSDMTPKWETMMTVPRIAVRLMAINYRSAGTRVDGRTSGSELQSGDGWRNGRNEPVRDKREEKEKKNSSQDVRKKKEK